MKQLNLPNVPIPLIPLSGSNMEMEVVITSWEQEAKRLELEVNRLRQELDSVYRRLGRAAFAAAQKQKEIK